MFDRLPTIVGRKFKYAHISREHRAAELEAALQHLYMARSASSSGTAVQRFVPSVWRDSRKLTDGSSVDYELLSHPLYQAGQSRRLMQSCLAGEDQS